ncbi:MAG: T9SS type A sorting domain-containing protein [Bacteroidota bacterium]
MLNHYSFILRFFDSTRVKKYSLLLSILLVFVISKQVSAQVSYTTAGSTYSQNFDGLYGAVPLNNTTQAATILPTGWVFVEAGTNANTTFRNDNGSSGTGDTYLDGATSSNERAFGSYASGSLTSQYGAFFTNNTGTTLTQFTLTYTGEQWKDGGSSAAILNKATFSYSIGATSLTVGTYTNVTALDFTALVNNITADVTTDGNAVGNRTVGITSTITGISWAAGTVLYIRWTDVNDAGNDDNLAIDDVSFQASTGSTPSINISPVHPIAANLNQGSNDNIIAATQLDVTVANATLNGVSLTTAGTYLTSDITNFKFWLSSSATSISGATQLGSTITTIPSSGASLSVSGLSNSISSGTTRYILVTSSISSTATPLNTVRFTSTAFSNITFASGTKTGTDPVSASNIQTFVAIPPSIALSDVSPAAGSINQSSTNNILRSINLNVTAAAAILNSVSFTTGGTYLTSDLQTNGFKVWYNTANNLTGATQLGASQPIVVSGGTISISGLTQSIPLGNSYILITADVSYNASSSRFINITSTPFSSITFATGIKTGTDPIVAGNNQTFANVTPSIAIAFVGPTASTVNSGTLNKVLYQVSFAPTLNSTNLNAISFTTAGTYQTTDLVADSIKLYFNTTNSIATATKLANVAVVSSGGTISFTGLNQFITVGTTVYVWLTADFSSVAVSPRTINITSTPFANITFSSGTKTGTDPLTAGGVITIAPKLTQEYFNGVLVPQYMSSGTSSRLPFMYRATLTNLSPSTTYRYFTNACTNSTAGGGTVDFGGANPGAGNPLFINSTGTLYTYSTGASLTSAGNYGTFTTDATGSFTGWFGVVNTGNARFTGGNIVYPTIAIGDSATGSLLALRILNDSLKVLTYATSAGANNGTFLKENTSNAIPRNFVAIYDNTAGTGKPVYISPVNAIDPTIASVITGYTVSTGGWNAIIPNNNANGIQRIEQRDFNNNIQCYSTDTDGIWSTGSVSTVNPITGSTPKIISILDAPLGPPSITSQPLATQSVCLNSTPTNLTVVASGSGLTYKWYSNTISSTIGATLIPSATTNTYTPSTTSSGTTFYYCEITSTCSSFSNIVSVVIKLPTSGSFSQSICPGTSYLFNGVNLTSAGTYLDTLVGSNSCDSFLTLNLSIKPTSSGSFSQSICPGTSYLYNGVNLTSAGSYLDTLVGSNGCDSFLTLNLSLKPTSSGSFSQTICPGTSYLFNGVNLSSAGSYLDTLVGFNGCDSFVTLNLIVRALSTGSFSHGICGGTSYLFNGLSLTDAGTYLDTLTSFYGCDSFLTLNLFIYAPGVGGCPAAPRHDNMCYPVNVTAGVTSTIPYSAVGYANINTHTDTVYNNNGYSTFQVGEPIGSCGTSGTNNKTLWYKFTAPFCATPSVYVSTDDRSTTNFNTRISVYRRVVPTSCSGGYTEIACNDNANYYLNTGATNNSTVVLTPNSATPTTNQYAPGEDLYIQTSGVGTASGNFGLIIDAEPFVPSVSSVGSGSAVVDWTTTMISPWGGISGAYIQWRPVGAGPTVGGTYAYIAGPSSTYTITGLLPGTNYEYWASYVCGNGGRWWSKKGTFTTSSSCVGTSPSIVSVIATTPCNTPTISFNATSLAYSSYRVIRRQIGSSVVLMSPAYYTSPSTQTYTSPALLLGRTYQFYVVAYCGTAKVDSSAISSYTVCASLRTANPNATEQVDEDKDVAYIMPNGTVVYGLPFNAMDLPFDATNPNEQTITLETMDANTYFGRDITPTVATATEGALSIYPNPANTEATLSYTLEKASDVMSIQVLDAQGKVMMTDQVSNPAMSGTYTINLNQYSAGVYFVKVQAGDYMQTRKLMVETR